MKKIFLALFFMAASSSALCTVYTQGYNLYCDALRISFPIATGYPNAVTHFDDSEVNEVVYLKHNRIEGGGFLADMFLAHRDASGCSPSCPRISRAMPLGHEPVKIVISKDGGKAAYMWGNRVLDNWEIDTIRSNGTNRVVVQTGLKTADRASLFAISCDREGKWLRFGAFDFPGGPVTNWYADTATGQIFPFDGTEWPGSCEIFRDGFESGSTSEWSAVG